MSQKLTASPLAISETGLKLIKAYEGYRPVDRELVTGQRVVGYGHRLYSENAVHLTKTEAEETLRRDLEPFEEMINTQVHAPLTQGQFDALCSFAFNIGPKAFLTSDTLRALNNGRPLDAANGLDIWRKSEIDGKTYVVDALMRRRTAEKALFLRTEYNLPAGRDDLPPVQDMMVASLTTEDALPVFSSEDANGVVATAPYEAKDAQFRRCEDGASGKLALSEIDEMPEPVLEIAEDDILELDIAEILPEETEVEPESVKTRSPIAEAASDIVARLDALIEDAGEDIGADTTDWPESLITSAGQAEVEPVEMTAAETPETSNLTTTGTKDSKLKTPKKPVMVIDELTQDDAFRARHDGSRVRTDSAAKYIQSLPPRTAVEAPEPARFGAGLWIPVLLGFLLLGASGAVWLRGAEALLGDWGPVLAIFGLITGVGLILAGVYAALRMNLSR